MVGLKRLVVVRRAILRSKSVRHYFLMVATSGGDIPKRDGFCSSSPLCRFVMNSMIAVVLSSSYTRVVC